MLRPHRRHDCQDGQAQMNRTDSSVNIEQKDKITLGERGPRKGGHMRQGQIRPFGAMPDGTPVEEVVLQRGGKSCSIITYGGALRALAVPDREGMPVDVVLGFDHLEDYRRQDKYLGALVGRYANRIGNSRFTLKGVNYPLAANNGKNHLHGGLVGFDKQVWRIEDCSQHELTLSLFSPDGQEGYPGNLRVQLTYTLTEDALTLDYQAVCDQDTPCNLTNHGYFNLSGHQSGPVGEQYIQILADAYTPADAGSIPTGEIAPVEGTPMDLRRSQKIGAHIDDDFPQLKMAGGYDHNWVLAHRPGELALAARAWSEETGITLEALTTMPGVQFYAGNYLDGCPAGKGGAPYDKRWGFCLETQFFPDSPNKPNFPSALLKAGETYRQQTVYRFSIR